MYVQVQAMNKEQKNTDFNDLIAKFISGNINFEENQLLNEWRSQNSENETVFQSFSKTWDCTEKTNIIQDINLDQEWINLTSRINGFNESHENNKFRFIKLYRIAAVFLVLALSIIVVRHYFFNNNERLLFAAEKPVELSLPDGSTISLNVFAEIKYPEKFSKETRTVSLQKGEAFFNIARDEEKPFIVETEKLTVKVLGTSFCVDVRETGETSVIVSTGKVEVTRREHPDDKQILNPGDKLIYSNNSDSFSSSVNDDSNFLGWKTKKLIFKNELFSKVISDINHTYHKNIIIENETLKNCRLTASFDDQSFEAVLRILESAMNINIKYTENSIVISGEGC